MLPGAGLMCYDAIPYVHQLKERIANAMQVLINRLLINRLLWRNKFLVDDSCIVHTANDHELDF